MPSEGKDLSGEKAKWTGNWRPTSSEQLPRNFSVTRKLATSYGLATGKLQESHEETDPVEFI